MEEKWKHYNEDYIVSTDGNIFSVRRAKMLSPHLDGDGYLAVTLYGKTLKMHRLIMLVFSGENIKETVNHKNGIKTDNRLENLEWMTREENQLHAIDNKLHAHNESVHTARLSVADVEKIKALFVEYKLNDTEIGDIFGVNNSTISNIRRKIAWKNILPDLIYERKSPSGRGMTKKLSAEDIPIIRHLISEGHSVEAVGKLYKVNPGTINGIISGKTWINY